MSNGFRRVPRSSEMNAFKTKIGGDQGLVTGRNPQHGAIVSDPGNHVTSLDGVLA